MKKYRLYFKLNLMPSRFISLAIIDEHVLFRKTLRQFLLDQTNINCVIQASDFAELLSKLRVTQIDVLLMDSMVPELNGIGAGKMLRAEFPSVKIILLSASKDLPIICDLMDCGIHGLISKSEEPEELLQAIQAVSEGRIYRNRLFTEVLYCNKQSSIGVKSRHGGSAITLSEREKRILNLIWEEKSNREIADELYLGVRSIEKIRQDLKEKIAVKSTIGLIKFAIQERIIWIGAKDPGLVRL
jgi:DNA-binding NarL/FixJ family response regulator